MRCAAHLWLGGGGGGQLVAAASPPCLPLPRRLLSLPLQMILAANYMDIKSLLDLCCAKVASMIKGKTTEEIRKTFNIKNDFTPGEDGAQREGVGREALTPPTPPTPHPPPAEEEAQVREENRWCEDA